MKRSTMVLLRVSMMVQWVPLLQDLWIDPEPELLHVWSFTCSSHVHMGSLWVLSEKMLLGVKECEIAYIHVALKWNGVPSLLYSCLEPSVPKTGSWKVCILKNE